MSATESVSAGATASEASPVRHALRRLSVYVRRNWRYYLTWFVVVVAYTGVFNAVPLVLGWAVDGLIDPEVEASVVIRRCWLLLGLALVGGVLRFYSGSWSSMRRGRSSTRSATTSSPTSSDSPSPSTSAGAPAT
ncbi:MAG: hypothetical protein R3E53_14650 [Myxococcota bacterium]